MNDAYSHHFLKGFKIGNVSTLTFLFHAVKYSCNETFLSSTLSADTIHEQAEYALDLFFCTSVCCACFLSLRT